MLNWIAWYRTVLKFNKNKQNKTKTVYLCKTELFEIELFDHLNVCKQMIDV